MYNVIALQFVVGVSNNASWNLCMNKLLNILNEACLNASNFGHLLKRDGCSCIQYLAPRLMNVNCPFGGENSS